MVTSGVGRPFARPEKRVLQRTYRDVTPVTNRSELTPMTTTPTQLDTAAATGRGAAVAQGDVGLEPLQ